MHIKGLSEVLGLKFLGKWLKWIVPAVLLTAAVIWIVRTNSDFEVTQYTVKSDRLPGGFDGFRVAQISDLHSTEWPQLAQTVRDGDIDAIFLTGDLVSRDDTDIPRSLLAELCEIAPVYFVPGNHESANEHYDAMRDALGELGVSVLEDSSVLLERGDDIIRIAGLADPLLTDAADGDRSDDSMRSTVDTALSSVVDGDDTFTVLLSHRPEYMMLYEAHSVDAVFCGHAHGGGVRLPFIGALWAPGQGFFPTYTWGLYESEYCDMIVSAGLGRSAEPFRVNCPYELVFCTFRQG